MYLRLLLVSFTLCLIACNSKNKDATYKDELDKVVVKPNCDFSSKAELGDLFNLELDSLNLEKVFPTGCEKNSKVMEYNESINKLYSNTLKKSIQVSDEYHSSMITKRNLLCSIYTYKDSKDSICENKWVDMFYLPIFIIAEDVLSKNSEKSIIPLFREMDKVCKLELFYTLSDSLEYESGRSYDKQTLANQLTFIIKAKKFIITKLCNSIRIISKIDFQEVTSIGELSDKEKRSILVYLDYLIKNTAYASALAGIKYSWLISQESETVNGSIQEKLQLMDYWVEENE